MNKYISIIILLAHSVVSFGQDQNDLDLLETDSTWRKEVFNFPIPFAKEIKFKGTADVRFAHGWEDEKSQNFWSYVFGWSLSLDEKLTENDLEETMRIYFDGLMKVVNKEDKELPNTIASFVESSDSDVNSGFKGSIKIYDAFFTKKTMLLNVTVDVSYCEGNQKTLMLFKVSPKSIGDDVWSHLDEVVYRNEVCGS